MEIVINIYLYIYIYRISLFRRSNCSLYFYRCLYSFFIFFLLIQHLLLFRFLVLLWRIFIIHNFSLDINWEDDSYIYIYRSMCTYIYIQYIWWYCLRQQCSNFDDEIYFGMSRNKKKKVEKKVNIFIIVVWVPSMIYIHIYMELNIHGGWIQ